MVRKVVFGQTMKPSLQGFLRFKPFDETVDTPLLENGVYRKPILTLGIISGALLTIMAFVLAFVDEESAVAFLALGTAVSTLTAGFEWQAGLRAKPLNQLFVSAVVVLAIMALVHW